MKKSVLLVEYDEPTITNVREILASPVYDITVANDGEAAKKVLATRSFDLVITAAMLPRFHGFNLSLHVAEEYPATRIIVISAIYKGNEYRHQATTQYRADDFFEKPLPGAKFGERVKELLGVNEEDLHPAPGTTTTEVPIFDTAKIPSLKRIEEEEKKFTSEDLFGDLIQKAEKVAPFEIQLDAKKSVAPPAPPPPRTAAPERTQVLPIVESPRAKTESAKTVEIPRPEIHLGVSHDGAKRGQEGEKYKKIEDDIARRFEETLSGLGLSKKQVPHAGKPASPPAPAKPEPPPPPPPPPRPVPPPPPPPKVDAAPERTVELPVPPAPVVKPAAMPEPAPAKQPTRPVGGIESAPPGEVGDYQILGMIARGGMAEIYKAKKKGVKGFEKIIAIKRILSGYGEDDKFIEMLVDEAKIAAELSHPNIVQIYDLGRKDNYYFIAMEYVQGKDLREIQRRLADTSASLPEDIALYIITKVLEALNYAHKAKDSQGRNLEIVHRDISPPNIMASYTGDVKLTDFGVSKASIKMHQTISGALKGKLLYMSPEQAKGEGNIDYRSDLYSVGVILFELITGRKLFLDSSEMAVLKKVQNGEIIAPHTIKADVDPELERIILRALKADRTERYQDAADMERDLNAYILRKFEYVPASVNLAHYLFHLFREEIVAQGIKVDLKPLTPRERQAPEREIEVPAPESIGNQPLEIRFDVPVTKPVPPPPPPPPRKKTPVAPPPSAKPSASVESMLAGLEEEKKRGPLFWGAIVGGAVLLLVVLYFLFLKPSGPTPTAPASASSTTKPAPAATNPAQTPPATPQAAGQQAPASTLPGATTQPLPAAKPGTVSPAVITPEEAAKKKQQELLLKQQETERLRKENERKAQEAAAAQLKADEDKKRQEDADRLKREEAVRIQNEQEQQRKAEEARKATEAAAQAGAVKPGDIVSLTDLDAPPVGVSTPSPEIPGRLSAALQTNPTVIVSLLIGPNGQVEKVKLVRRSGNSQLDDLLVNTVKNWRYQPVTKNKMAVRVWKSVTMTFKK